MQVVLTTRHALVSTYHKFSLYKAPFRHSGNHFAQSRTKSYEAFKLKSTLYYVASGGVLAVGLSYAAVPLYRIFCQAYSYGGTTTSGGDVPQLETVSKRENRVLTIKFNADLGASMRWNFKPLQAEIDVTPGETALAFYTAKNPSDTPVVGISTYNVVPFEAGQYFNKIQCFCFEEQQLNPQEEVFYDCLQCNVRGILTESISQVDMPVYFYIDPAICDDPKMELIDTITLSYTFFEAKENVRLAAISNTAKKPFSIK